MTVHGAVEKQEYLNIIFRQQLPICQLSNIRHTVDKIILLPKISSPLRYCACCYLNLSIISQHKEITITMFYLSYYDLDYMPRQCIYMIDD